MENKTRSTHPMIIVASSAVTIASLVAIAWFAGLLPIKQEAIQAPQAVVAPAASAPATPQAPVAESTEKTTSTKTTAKDAPILQTPPHKVTRQTKHVSDSTYSQGSYGASAPTTANGAYTDNSRQSSQYSNSCRDCATVESIREVKQDGEGSGVGAISGGVVGGLLGNQIGGGRGKTVGAVVGAVGGAYAGHEIEKNVRSTKHYEITVRFDNGNTQVFTEAQQPSLQQGNRVRVSNGQLVLM